MMSKSKRQKPRIEKQRISPTVSKKNPMTLGVTLAQNFNASAHDKTASEISPRASTQTPAFTEDSNASKAMQQKTFLSLKRDPSYAEIIQALDVRKITVNGLVCHVCQPSTGKPVNKSNVWIYIEGNGFGVYPPSISFRKAAWVALADQTQSTVIVIHSPPSTLNLTVHQQANTLAGTLKKLASSQNRDINEMTIAGYSSGATLLMIALNKLCNEDDRLLNQMKVNAHFIGLLPFVAPLSNHDERTRLWRLHNETSHQSSRSILGPTNPLEDMINNQSFLFYLTIMSRLGPSHLGERAHAFFQLVPEHFMTLIDKKIHVSLHDLTKDPLSHKVNQALNQTIQKNISVIRYDKSHNAPWCDGDFIRSFCQHIKKTTEQEISPIAIRSGRKRSYSESEGQTSRKKPAHRDRRASDETSINISASSRGFFHSRENSAFCPGKVIQPKATTARLQ